MKRIKNIALYSFVLILLFVAVLFYRQLFFVMLMLLWCTLLPLSVALCRYDLEKLSVDLKFAVNQAEKGLTVPLTLSITNPSWIPLLHVECVLQLCSPYYEKPEDTIYVLPASAKRTTTLKLPVTYAHCGLFEGRVTHVKVWDYLHIFSFEKECKASTYVAIFPESHREVSYHPSFYGEGFDEYETSSLKGNVSSNVTDVREYQPGDRLQKIHWKLSAKIDKLMVKENEATSSHQFFVLLELFADPDHPEWLDESIEYAYGLGNEFLFRQETFFFGFYSQKKNDFSIFPIRYESELQEGFLQAFYETTYEEENLAKTTYLQAGMNLGTMIQVTHEGVFDEAIF